MNFFKKSSIDLENSMYEQGILSQWVSVTML